MPTNMCNFKKQCIGRKIELNLPLKTTTESLYAIMYHKTHQMYGCITTRLIGFNRVWLLRTQLLTRREKSWGTHKILSLFTSLTVSSSHQEKETEYENWVIINYPSRSPIVGWPTTSHSELSRPLPSTVCLFLFFLLSLLPHKFYL